MPDSPSYLKHYDPILVMGPGRCGSSAVAGMLHACGVSMGMHLKPPDEFNPSGYFEELELVHLVNAVIDRKISIRLWNLGIAVMFAEMRKPCRPWGLKHPALCDVFLSLSGHLLAPKIVRVHRSMESCVDSMVAAYASTNGWNQEQAANIYRTREERLNSYVTDYDVLDVHWEYVIKDAGKELSRILQFIDLQVDDEVSEKVVSTIY